MSFIKKSEEKPVIVKPQFKQQLKPQSRELRAELEKRKQDLIKEMLTPTEYEKRIYEIVKELRI